MRCVLSATIEIPSRSFKDFHDRLTNKTDSVCKTLSTIAQLMAIACTKGEQHHQRANNNYNNKINKSWNKDYDERVLFKKNIAGLKCWKLWKSWEARTKSWRRVFFFKLKIKRECRKPSETSNNGMYSKLCAFVM